ncbi:DUF4112 domain-containing protein [Acidicapsa acidisoli]|uniref:DUF4112 domain-containing protein n=1 Tax=Acidicapsa acidisoli TaxID=1615681 RepID=UPI0021DFD679|nr:DUF4112 domain-containing protein [Acidicapsa acidisoli]
MPSYQPQGLVEPPEPSRRAGQTASARPGNRWNQGSMLLSDDRLQWLEILLDEAFVIPGTRIRFGIDGIIGLIPGLGDVLVGILSLVIPLVAWIRGTPYITLVRMLTNVSIGLLIGTIPILGDAFDIFWKANRRNYRLLTRSIAEPHRHTWRDWGFLFVLGAGIAIVFAIPVAFVIWLVTMLAHWRPVG